MVTKTLPYPTLDAVARYRATNSPARYGQPEPRMVDAIGTQDECHELRFQPSAARKDAFEILAPPEPVLGPEASIGGPPLRP